MRAWAHEDVAAQFAHVLPWFTVANATVFGLLLLSARRHAPASILLFLAYYIFQWTVWSIRESATRFFSSFVSPPVLRHCVYLFQSAWLTLSFLFSLLRGPSKRPRNRSENRNEGRIFSCKGEAVDLTTLINC